MLDARLAAAVGGHIHQYEIISDLLAGHYEPVTTVGAAFAGANLGLGVAECLDGEIVGCDGQVWRVPADGTPVRAPDDLGLAFAVVASEGRSHEASLAPGSTLDDISHSLIDIVGEALVGAHAVRLDGTFTDVLLRSEDRQEPPFPPLPAVLEHESRFAFDHWTGTLVGFRFPDASDGLVVPGLHLHAIATDRRSGGHVHTATVDQARLRVWVEDCDIDLPHRALAHLLIAGAD